jgi:hypothetical protein
MIAGCTGPDSPFVTLLCRFAETSIAYAHHYQRFLGQGRMKAHTEYGRLQAGESVLILRAKGIRIIYFCSPATALNQTLWTK